MSINGHVQRHDRIGCRIGEPGRGSIEVEGVGIARKYDYRMNQKKQRKRVYVGKGDSKLQNAKRARLEYIYLGRQQEDGDTQ